MQRKQYLVKLDNSNEGRTFINYLEQNGFKNLQNLSYETLRIKVFVIQKYEFFTTNVTCLSAAAMVGIKPISIDEFKEEFENENTLSL